MLTLEEAMKIIDSHQQEPRELPPNLHAAALEIATQQGGWLNVSQANSLLSRLTGREYTSEATPLYKAIERGLIAQQKGRLTSETRIEIESFIEYLRAFKVRI